MNLGRVLVVGMARSGRSAARLALASGAREVCCTDLRADADAVPGTRSVFGRHERADFLTADLIVLSPGVPGRAPDPREDIPQSVAPVDDKSAQSASQAVKHIRFELLSTLGARNPWHLLLYWIPGPLVSAPVVLPPKTQGDAQLEAQAHPQLQVSETRGGR